MKTAILKSLFASALLLAVPVTANAERAEHIHRIVGYLPDWSYQAYKDIDFSALTNVNIAFCNPDKNGQLSCYIPDKDFEKIVAAAHDNGAEVFAALGGAGGCETYLQFIDTPEEMAEFDKGIIEYCEKYDLDGIDLDIELGSYHQIWSYYENWCSDLRELCDEHDLKMSTATAHWVAEKVSPETFAKFDFVNVMAYDNDEDESSHSTYEYAVECLSYFHDEKKIPSEKLVLGVPFYGRGYNERGELDWDSYESFADLVGKDDKNYSRDLYNGIAYNGAETMSKKSLLGAEYGGIMIWELTQDAKGERSLLKVINETLGTDSFIAGDANADGTFDTADLVSLSRYLLGRNDSGLKNSEAADLCKDGVLDIFDMIAMRKLILKQQ